MKNEILKYIVLLSILMVQGCATKPPGKLAKKTADYFSPSSSYVLLDHGAFKVYYDTDTRLAKYVVYPLSKEQLSNRSASRKNKFKVDPLLEEMNLPRVSPAEYKKSGYDQGHLAPAADFSWSQKANDETFVMSNMVPQKTKLNRGAWKRLEDKVRKWACGEESITVITGPLISNSSHKLKSGLIVPESFFKIIIDETPPQKIIGFIYFQEDVGDLVMERQVAVEKIEGHGQFKLASIVPRSATILKRVPASINEWKEGDCEL